MLHSPVALADPGCLAVFLESKFNYVLSWTEVRVASDCIWGTPPIDRSRHLLTDEFLLIFSWAYRRSSMVLPFHCKIISVFLNTSFTLSFLPGLPIIHHFLSFGEKPNSGPRVLKMSHHFLISVVEPVPPVSSANEHCFAVDTTCRLVIRGRILRTQRAIAIESPCVVPSALWQDPLSADDKLILVSKSWSRK